MRKASKVLMTFDSDSTTMMWLLLTIRLRLVLERKKHGETFVLLQKMM